MRCQGSSLRTHGHRARVFRELRASQNRDVLYAADGARIQIRGKLVVAVHGEALFERQLKPVAARHSIAGPVVEVLVANDTFDTAEIQVSGRLGRRHHET